MGDLIAIAIILCVVGGAVYSLCRARKRGAACMGCSLSGQCGGCGNCGREGGGQSEACSEQNGQQGEE